MKLQLDGDGMRWRVDEAELASLQAGSGVRMHAAGGGLALRCEVDVHAGPGARLSIGAGRWALTLPAAGLAAYVARLPCREAWEIDAESSPAQTPVRVRFEVDVRDSVRSGRVRRGDAGR